MLKAKLKRQPAYNDDGIPLRKFRFWKEQYYFDKRMISVGDSVTEYWRILQ